MEPATASEASIRLFNKLSVLCLHYVEMSITSIPPSFPEFNTIKASELVVGLMPVLPPLDKYPSPVA